MSEYMALGLLGVCGVSLLDKGQNLSGDVVSLPSSVGFGACVGIENVMIPLSAVGVAICKSFGFFGI